MVSVCLPSDALSQHLPSYLGFSYLGRGVSLHGCSSKAQPLLLTLDEGYLLTAAPPDLEHGVAPLGPPAPMQPLHFGRGVAPLLIVTPSKSNFYPKFKVRRGSCEEIPLVQGKEQWLCFAGAAVKRTTMSKVRETQVRW